MKRAKYLLAAAVLCGLAGFAKAESLSLSFDSDTVGQLPSGWTDPSNAATSAVVAAPGANGDATQSLYVFNNGNGNDGVINNVLSPGLSTLSGLTGPGTQPGATSNVFTSSYKFSTASSSAVAGFQFKSESYGSDRTTWVDFYNDGSGNLKVQYAGADNSGNFVYTSPAGDPSLQWGAWYTVDTTINFATNTVVTDVFDATNSLVASITGTTWEGYYASVPQTIPGANAIQFQMRDSAPDAAGASNGVYVDDVVLSAAPLPPVAWVGLALMAGVGIAARLKRRENAVA